MALTRPGRIRVATNGALILPDRGSEVATRSVYLTVGVEDTVLNVNPQCMEVVYIAPPGTRIAAFVVDEDAHGNKSQGGPILYFWTPDATPVSRDCGTS